MTGADLLGFGLLLAATIITGALLVGLNDWVEEKTK